MTTVENPQGAPRPVVVCSQGRSCRGDHHGWDCPLSDPMGDCLRTLLDWGATPGQAAAWGRLDRGPR